MTTPKKKRAAGARAETAPAADDKTAPNRGFLGTLGPGLITGASDDDPSGIGTYSQAGAQLGFSISWTMVLTFPLMVAVQEISARIGRTTGTGVAGNLRKHYPRWLLRVLVVLLFAANVVNVAADLAAMGDALKLLIGGPALLYVVVFGAGCVLAQIFLHYENYVRTLKWLCLTLFAYVAALAVVKVPWGQALKGILVPTVQWKSDYFTTLVAIAGTTISPYLFIWQASQEAEEVRVKPQREPLLEKRSQARPAFERIRADTIVGMAFSNIIAIAIMITAAATLHAHNVTNIETSAQAAKALEPIAGHFAAFIFTAGIIGTGLLGVPVLAGSAAYAVCEARRWRVGLSREPNEAVAFYVTLSIAAALGVAINFTPIDPIAALYWSAVINGVVAVPFMALLMLMASRRKVMGLFTVKGPLRVLGWVATLAMLGCVGGMAATLLM